LIEIEDCGTWTAGGDGRPAQAEGFVRVIGGPVSAAPESQWETPREPVPELLNRTGILAVLAETLERTERENGSCALLIAAIDNLGVLNDSYGFQVADELIAGVATRLSDTMRHEHSLGRLSGNK